MIATYMSQIGNHTNMEFSESLFKHMALNTIRSFRQKYRAKYGELIIACDSKNTWRKQLFPYYKASRKQQREQSEVDWNSVHKCMNEIREELKLYFPYRVLSVEHAEADDIIAVITKHVQETEKVLILSADKDFIQLQAHPNVEQVDPVRRKVIKNSEPDKYLFEHIVRGDRGDGVPNIYSADDVFVNNVRMKPIRSINIDSWYGKAPEEFCPDKQTLDNYNRNKQLIDLSMIPTNIQENIIAAFDSQQDKQSKDLFNYFVANRLNKLIDNIGDFL